MGPTGEHAILQLHPSRRCNLRCLHCYSDSSPDVRGALPVELLVSALEDAASLGYRVVGVSGGEPLLYPHLRELLVAAKSLGFRTTVTTNGLLADERRLGRLSGLVDVLAISLDGSPGSHASMRGDPRAFDRLDARMGAVTGSGIPFGFIATLTMFNADELGFVAEYAAAHGASLVQTHPLEAAGAAVGHLPGAVPDEQELAFGLVEAARLSLLHGLPIQVDVAARADLEEHPERFFAAGPSPFSPGGEPLSPLVVEADGWLVPLSYGFPRRFALGDLDTGSLSALVRRWDPGPFEVHCRQVRERLLASGRAFFNWFDEASLVNQHQGVALVAAGPADGLQHGRGGGAGR